MNFSALSRLFSVLPVARRGALGGAVLVAFVAAFFETAGVASILPFMALAMDPAALDRFEALTAALHQAGVDSYQEKIAALGSATIAILFLGNAAAAMNLWWQSRLIASLSRDLSSELFNGYLNQPYQFHLHRDAASLTKVINQDVESAVGGFLSNFMLVGAKTLSASLLIGVLVWKDPRVAFGALTLFGGAYATLYFSIRSWQSRLGQQVSQIHSERSRITLEGINAVKELLVLGRAKRVADTFDQLTLKLVSGRVTHTLAAQLPRHLIEIFAFGGIIGLTVLLSTTGQTHDVVSTLALYVLAGYRLLPAFQTIFNSLIALRYHQPAVHSLESDLKVFRADRPAQIDSHADSVFFQTEIRFQDVTFFYPSAFRPAVRNISLSIPRNQTLGLVGRTGAGKTTLVDLALGLYLPTTGYISVDGIKLSDLNSRAWRSRIGYVPQTIFLANGTVTENIAFGIAPSQVDLFAVEQAARLAQAEGFILGLPQGFDTIVGERGVKLSGGQRQRLGIARALYHNPDILIFDEATSALDLPTEESVMSAVRNLRQGRSVLIISHRLASVRLCDRIVVLDEGEIVAVGNYMELLARSPLFRRLVGRDNSQDGAILGA